MKGARSRLRRRMSLQRSDLAAGPITWAWSRQPEPGRGTVSAQQSRTSAGLGCAADRWYMEWSAGGTCLAAQHLGFLLGFSISWRRRCSSESCGRGTTGLALQGWRGTSGLPAPAGLGKRTVASPALLLRRVRWETGWLCDAYCVGQKAEKESSLDFAIVCSQTYIALMQRGPCCRSLSESWEVTAGRQAKYVSADDELVRYNGQPGGWYNSLFGSVSHLFRFERRRFLGNVILFSCRLHDCVSEATSWKVCNR